MKEDGVQPTYHTFISLFKVCTSVADLQGARRLHADAHRTGFSSHVYVGSALITMYSKCGSLVNAENVFNELSQRNVVSWNAMLTAYVDHKRGEKVLQLYRQMRDERFSPYQHTYLLTLQACGMLVEREEAGLLQGQPIAGMALEIGKALHIDARRQGFTSHLFLSNTLVSVYGKCRGVLEAEDVFDGMPQVDVVSWNAMLSAYVEQGQGQSALQLYTQMLLEGECPNEQTCTITLKACSNFVGKEESAFDKGHHLKVKSLQIGFALHAAAGKKGFSSSSVIGSVLLNVYGKCGSIEEAENVFSGLLEHDIVSWSAMLSVYAEQGLGVKAFLLYRQMIEERICPDQQAFAITLHACYTLVDGEYVSLGEGWPTAVVALEIGQALHADAKHKAFTSNVFVCNTLIILYGKCRRVREVENVFDGSLNRSIVTWNAMLSVYVELGQEEKTLQLFKQMHEEGFSSNQQQTYVITLQACYALLEKEQGIGGPITSMYVDIGEALHADTLKKGFASETFVGNTLISLYGKCGSILEARMVFDELSQRDIVSWNAMLSAYSESSQGEEVLHLYELLLAESVALNESTIIRVLQACSENGALDMCWQLHFCAVVTGCDPNSTVANTLIHAYGNCASMADARAVFSGLHQPDIVSWNACLTGYAQEGNFPESLGMFMEIKPAGAFPDGITFLTLLTACCHTGLVNQGIEYLELMLKGYCAFPESKHYVVMVDILGRAGTFEMMRGILWGMPMRADLSICLRLLGACRMHGNVELAQEAFNHAVVLHPKEATAYILMSNIFVEAGLQEQADNVKMLGQMEVALDEGWQELEWE